MEMLVSVDEDNGHFFGNDASFYSFETLLLSYL